MDQWNIVSNRDTDIYLEAYYTMKVAIEINGRKHKFLNSFGKLVYTMENNNTGSLPNTTYKNGF